MDSKLLRPVILAGGLGTRLQPRTLYIPKPLIPINGRPILWYILKSIETMHLGRPIVVTSYKSELIEAFFAGWDVDFEPLHDFTMLECFLQVIEKYPSYGYVAMSADVIVPTKAIAEVTRHYINGEAQNLIAFTELPDEGHKKWEFVTEESRLVEVNRSNIKTRFERISLILEREAVITATSKVNRPITEHNIPEALKPFQTGWILLLKLLLKSNIIVESKKLDTPMVNINTPKDIEFAESIIGDMDFSKLY